MLIIEMLREFALPALEALYEEDEEGLGELIFMQDGAPPHFAGLPILQENFPER